ncbi:MAG: hypothetical protein GYA29_04215 [Methanothrix sp.]|nr:hypothetical protein [Methanothrix sp.]
MRYLIAFILLIASCQAKTIVVDSGGSGDATSLASAITMASSGDTILIKPGNYSGAIVDRSLIINGSGQAQLDGSLIIIAPGCKITNLATKSIGRDPAIVLQSSDNLLVRCRADGASIGIRATGDDNTVLDCNVDAPRGTCMELLGKRCKVLNSTFLGNVGIKLNGTIQNTIAGCEILAAQGVLMDLSIKNRIEKNSFYGSGFGVVLSRSSSNQILENNISGTYISGIDVVDSKENNITGNFISGGKLGISLRGSQGNNVTENVCQKGERAGIYGDGAVYNYLSYNELSENGNGILLSGSIENGLKSNSASRNIYGISLRGSKGNVLRDNVMFANSYNLRVDEGASSSAHLAASSHDFYVQDIDESNLVDGRPVCYLINEADLVAPSVCGFLGIISCKNITASNLRISNSSAGILAVNSTDWKIVDSGISLSENGIYLKDCSAWTVKGCRAANCQIGYAASSSSDGTFKDDLASNCSEEGFRADDSLNLSLENCSAKSCAKGIYLMRSRLCNVLNCRADQNQEAGIQLTSSDRCSLIGNIASLNDQGIALAGSNECVLTNNRAEANQRDGISLVQLLNCELQDNDAIGNAQGIFVQSSKKLLIKGNNMSENSRNGLYMSGAVGCNVTDNRLQSNRIAGANLVDCTANFLYHNLFLDNAAQDAVDNNQNQWDAGPNDGGNYWSDHKVVGNPGDVPMQIPTKGVDRYPFQDPGGWL